MVVITKGVISLSLLSYASTMVMWGSNQCFGKNILHSTGKNKFWKVWIGALAATL